MECVTIGAMPAVTRQKLCRNVPNQGDLTAGHGDALRDLGLAVPTSSQISRSIGLSEVMSLSVSG
jgi:hypothetical protein